MRHKVSAKATARYFAAAALAASGVLFAGALSAPGQAYSGAQAEAQSDPRSADPYSFPNIDLCCKKKKWRRRGQGGGNGGGGGGPDDDGSGNGRAVRVSCGAPQRYSYSSIGEALAHVREGGRIVVAAGAPCDVSGLTFDQGVIIETDDREYGARASLSGGECVTVAPSYPTSVVSFRNVDIEGCFEVQSGRLDLSEVNLSSRKDSDAVELGGAGSLSMTQSTIRARGTAINAERGGWVSLTSSRIASVLGAPQVVRLNVQRADLRDTLVKGAKVGVLIEGLGRQGVTMSRVEVLRADDFERSRSGRGEHGIVVGSSAESGDLPSLPGLPAASFTISDSKIDGYDHGVTLAAYTNSVVTDVRIFSPKHGIYVHRGAYARLERNRIERSRYHGIYLEEGALGTASGNYIQCDHGYCVCYDGDCTSRSGATFGRGAFTMTGTDCND